MLDKIKNFLLSFLFKKHFTFRFQYYESDAVVTDTNVIEYEFVNLGTAPVSINDMQLLPDQFPPSAIPPQYENIFRRYKPTNYYNEVDTTIYRIKFPLKFDCSQICFGKVTIEGWAICGGGGLFVPSCSYTIQLFYSSNGNNFPINAPFQIDCFTGNTALKWQNLIIANLLPEFVGVGILVSFFGPDPLGLFTIDIDVANLQVPCDESHELSLSIEPDAVGCATFNVTPTPMSCTIPTPDLKCKLLVISKCLAGLKDNP
jgi:hypothetical protein